MPYSLIALLLSIGFDLLGQNNCPQYPSLIADADTQLQKERYIEALNLLSAAREYCPTKSKEIDIKIQSVVKAIEDKKVEAEQAKRQAIKEKEAAIAAKRKVNKVLSKIYFYSDHFGLSYDGNAIYGLGGYGFIDRQLNTKIDFKYQEALPFDETGFAKVKRQVGMNNKYFLIDTFGVEFSLATDIEHLTEGITALDRKPPRNPVLSTSEGVWNFA